MAEDKKSLNPSEIVDLVIEQHLYTVDRGIYDYQSLLGPDFAQTLEQFNGSHHWVDMGAGDALAQEQFLTERQRDPGREIPRLTAVAYRGNPSGAIPLSQMNVLSGRKFEYIDETEISKADLITDVVGVLNYTTELSKTLQTYLALLNPDGMLMVHLPASATVIESNTGERIFFIDWLHRIDGIQVSETELGLSSILNRSSFWIRKKHPTPIVPKLVLSSARHEKTLYRLFKSAN